MNRRPRSGFSLVELFIVLAIIAMLAALAVSRIHNYKHKFYVAKMMTDLHNLAVSEEAYFGAEDIYSSDIAAMRFVPSPQVTIVFVEANVTGWSATASHANDASTCAVYYGSAAILPPATAKTIIGCN